MAVPAASADKAGPISAISSVTCLVTSWWRRASPARAGAGCRLRYQMELSLEEAVRGVERKSAFLPWLAVRLALAPAPKKAPTQHLRTCNGHGQVRMQQGFFSVQQTCPRCHGRGQVIEDPCTSCRGRGVTEETKPCRSRSLRAWIPEIEFVWLAKARRLQMVAEPEIYTSRLR